MVGEGRFELPPPGPEPDTNGYCISVETCYFEMIDIEPVEDRSSALNLFEIAHQQEIGDAQPWIHLSAFCTPGPFLQRCHKAMQDLWIVHLIKAFHCKRSQNLLQIMGGHYLPSSFQAHQFHAQLIASRLRLFLT